MKFQKAPGLLLAFQGKTPFGTPWTGLTEKLHRQQRPEMFKYFSLQSSFSAKSCVQIYIKSTTLTVCLFNTVFFLLLSSQLLAVSDLFTERNQFEMMYTTLTELRKVHPSEDEILLQYLVPALCKAAAVLGMVRFFGGIKLSVNLLPEFYILDRCFSTSAMLSCVDFSSWHSLASMLDGEFWELKSTDFKVAEVEKDRSRYF